MTLAVLGLSAEWWDAVGALAGVIGVGVSIWGVTRARHHVKP